MPRRETRPKSSFLGPHYRFFNIPFPGRILLQLHNLQPGEFSEPDDLRRAQEPKVLLPSSIQPVWFTLNPRFQFTFRQDFLRIELSAIKRALGTQFFNLRLFLGVTTFAYNTITDPAGRFAFGGTATITWTDL